MDLKALSRNQLLQTLAYYLGFIGLGLVMVSSGPHLQNLLEHTNATMDAFGTVFIIASIGFLIGSFVGGHLYDRFKGHLIMAVCFILMAISMAVMPFIGNMWIMAGVMMLNGFSMSLVDMGTNTLLTWVHGEKSAPFMNALHLAFGIGAAISPIMIGKIINATGDIYWSYWTLAAIMVPLIILFLSVKSPAIRKAEDASEAEVASQLNGKKARATLVILLTTFFLFYVGAEANFGNFITSYVQKSFPMANEDIPYLINTLFWGAFTLGRLIGIPITAMWKTGKIISIDMVVCVVAFLPILLFRNSLVALGAGSILAGLGMASVFPTMMTYGEQNLRLTARITSYFYIGISGANMFFSWLIAQLFDNQGPFSVMVVLSILVVVQVLLWGMISRLTMKPQQA
ncbi:MAG: MFS transporter [Anaerolineae bacterium]|jgi:FHS family Na+ dependent glucose MFS transporter 1|nr:MFS transporter [Anaerolineae bacterium]